MQSIVRQNTASTLVIAAALFSAAVVALIAWSLLHERRQRRERRDELLRFGFAPLQSAPAGLIARINDLRGGDPLQSGSEQVPKGVYHRPIAGGDLYLFEGRHKSGRWGTISGDVAVVAPTLQLPRLMLVPHLQLSGAMDDLLGGVARNAVNQAHTMSDLLPVAIDDPSSFAQHYVALGRDAEAVRTFLSPVRLLDLLALDRKYVIDGEADILVIATGMAALMNPSGNSRRPNIDAYTLHQDMEQLLALFYEPTTPDRGRASPQPKP